MAFTLGVYTHMLPRFDQDAARTIAALVLGTINAAGQPSEGGSVAKSVTRDGTETGSGSGTPAQGFDEE